MLRTRFSPHPRLLPGCWRGSLAVRRGLIRREESERRRRRRRREERGRPESPRRRRSGPSRAKKIFSLTQLPACQLPPSWKRTHLCLLPPRRRGKLRNQAVLCSPDLLANSIPELARKCFFHLLVALGTSMRPPRQVVVYVCVGIFSSGIFSFSLDLHSTSQQLRMFDLAFHYFSLTTCWAMTLLILQLPHTSNLKGIFSSSLPGDTSEGVLQPPRKGASGRHGD
ncbi:hypothetical protein MC885_018696 [Smutsia gigantea]|nr:hypothetical protein MC885_018696 [Smutsia gigantea]